MMRHGSASFWNRGGSPNARPALAESLWPIGRPAPWRSGAILALCLFSLILTAPDSLLNDPDTLWHVEVGRWIVAHRAVPWVDPYSHTFAGAPWIAKEWLSQLILFAAHGLAGWTGVVLVAALSITAAFTILHQWLRRRAALLVALAATLCAMLLACPHFLARPHILVLPIVVLWMTGVVGALDRRSAPPLPLALLMVLWANMHGSFPLGLVIAGVIAGEGIVLAPVGSRGGSLRGWSVFLAVSLGATMLSPYGWHALAVPLLMSGNAETLRFISEWQPLHLDLVGALALALLATGLAILLFDARRNLFRIVALGLLAYLMIRHVRFISLFAIIAPILAARTLARLSERSKTPRFGPLDDGLVQASMMLALVALAAIALTLAALMRPAPVARYVPEAAYRFALAHGVDGSVYNDYDFGGFLIANGTKTFIDGRTDQLFLGDFLPDLDRAIKADRPEAFALMLRGRQVRWALVRAASKADIQLSRMPGWSRLYGDDVAAVYRAP